MSPQDLVFFLAPDPSYGRIPIYQHHSKSYASWDSAFSLPCRAGSAPQHLCSGERLLTLDVPQQSDSRIFPSPSQLRTWPLPQLPFPPPVLSVTGMKVNAFLNLHYSSIINSLTQRQELKELPEQLPLNLEPLPRPLLN